MEAAQWLPAAGRGGNGEQLLMDGVSLWGDDDGMELDNGDDCTTL